MANVPARFQPEIGFTRLPDMIDQLFRESFVLPNRFERFFDGRKIAGLSNLLETDNAFVVQLVLPGVDPEKIEIQVVQQQLTIKATCFIPPVDKAVYVWHGLVTEEFSEVFTLPMEVVGDKAEAHYDKGILTITLPKVEYAKAKAIKVHAT
jgi:HSP20 family protein